MHREASTPDCATVVNMPNFWPLMKVFKSLTLTSRLGSSEFLAVYLYMKSAPVRFYPVGDLRRTYGSAGCEEVILDGFEDVVSGSNLMKLRRESVCGWMN